MGILSRIVGKGAGGAGDGIDRIAEQAQSDLAAILEAFAEGRFAPETTLLDVFFAYRLLLNRCPEHKSARFLQGRTAELPTPHDLTQTFMAANEFRDLFVGVSQEKEGRMVVVRDGDVQVAVDVADLGDIVDQAQQDLARILTDFARGKFTAETTALDVFFAYRLFLNRSPEQFAAGFLRDRVATFDRPFDLARNFISGSEFRGLHFGEPLREDGRIVLVRDGRLRIAVDLDDVIIGWAIINGGYAPHVRWALENLVQEGFVCVDLGANVGYFTAIMAQSAGERGRVIAYEPFPRVHRVLAITVEESGLQRRVDIRRKACTDRVSQATMFFSEQVDNLGGAFLSEQVEAGSADGFAHLEVPTTTLDGDLAGEARVDLIKMDVEGSELRALCGMRRRLASDRPLLITEINPVCLAREKTTPGEVLDFLRDCGYAVYRLESIREGRPEAIESGSGPALDEEPEDILCVERGKADAVVEGLLATRG